MWDLRTLVQLQESEISLDNGSESKDNGSE